MEGAYRSSKKKREYVRWRIRGNIDMFDAEDMQGNKYHKVSSMTFRTPKDKILDLIYRALQGDNGRLICIKLDRERYLPGDIIECNGESMIVQSHGKPMFDHFEYMVRKLIDVKRRSL